jgi:hypothetical protein
MARIAGRDAVLYAGITSAGVAEPIAYLSQWAVSFTTNKIDITAFGDVTKTYVAGLPDFTGTYNGFYDTATAQLYTAASDGVARKFYLYPTRNTTTQYWFGTAMFDMSIDATVDGPVSISGGFSAASAVAKQG